MNFIETKIGLNLTEYLLYKFLPKVLESLETIGKELSEANSLKKKELELLETNEKSHL